jgi:hypothetical protein
MDVGDTPHDVDAPAVLSRFEFERVHRNVSNAGKAIEA